MSTTRAYDMNGKEVGYVIPDGNGGFFACTSGGQRVARYAVGYDVTDYNGRSMKGNMLTMCLIAETQKPH